MVRGMASSTDSLDATEVVRLAALSSVTLRPEDAEALAAAFAGHCEMVAPLLEFRLEDEPVATTYDPRWRG